ncbi:hypothetical protein MGN01_45830 [Methylobacterium gnaphalii]|uniref:Uncharacterized protein n=1 Tax=Methylobacterium gnaphalii TaxID=1010610 RepID=A0A512JS07_9HYPH|nr:hypothetical protein MGN01_45830 [Methylobacterium gnaphalii]GLS51335.1 hypothetical protein GCM10007885_41900 [Methylobacterium gnaphalii]
MARQVTYTIVDCPKGGFAVVVFTASGVTYRRDSLPSFQDAEICVEDLRTVLTSCGTQLTLYEHDRGETNLMAGSEVRDIRTAACAHPVRTRDPKACRGSGRKAGDPTSPQRALGLVPQTDIPQWRRSKGSAP